MRKRFNPYSMPPWVKHLRDIGFQVIVPLAIFQGIRTILFPTSFDVLLLATLIGLALAYHNEWI